jgi:hypothetical protein
VIMTTTATTPGEAQHSLPGENHPGENPADSKAFNLISGAVYTAALLSTGYALFDALVAESKRVGELTAVGDWAAYVAALAGVLVIECFAIIVANLSTAARLAGRRAIMLRLIPAAGVLYSGGLNVTAHWADSKVIAIFLPGVGALGLVVWLMRVEHKYRARFEAIKAERDAARNARRHDLTTRERVSYVFAKGPWKVIKAWKLRTVNIGDATRAAYEKRILAGLDFAAPAELVDKASAEITERPAPVRATATVERVTPAALTESTRENRAIERTSERRPDPAPAPVERTPIADSISTDRAPAPRLRAVGGQPSVEEMADMLDAEWKGTIPGRGAYSAVTEITGVKGQGKISRALDMLRERYAA